MKVSGWARVKVRGRASTLGSGNLGFGNLGLRVHLSLSARVLRGKERRELRVRVRQLEVKGSP